MENRGTYPQMVYTIFSYDTIACIGIRILYLEQIPKYIHIMRNRMLTGHTICSGLKVIWTTICSMRKWLN